MIYVYAQLKTTAEAWARGQGIRPKHFRAFGTRSRGYDGLRILPDDRVVFVGQPDQRVQAYVTRMLLKTHNAPQIERYDEPVASAPA